MNESATKILNRIFIESKLKAHVNKCYEEGPFLICDLILEPGGKVSKIENHSTEIALALKSKTEPIIYAIPHKGIIRLELLMREPKMVKFNDLSSSKEFISPDKELPIILGKTRRGNSLVVDLASMPHLLIAGATGSGKSVMLQSIICSLLLHKKQIMLALIDPKRVEFSYYDKVPHLWSPIARDVDSSLSILTDLNKEMNKRFAILQKNKCRNILEYKGKMPYIVVIIDELADLMMTSKKESQDLITLLAQKSRACGIHLIVSTQRPSVDIITGVIKANFPARLSCRVSSSIDSRVILDKSGAERLLGNGDAIIDSTNHHFIRFKGAFLTENDIINVIKNKRSWWSKLWTNS